MTINPSPIHPDEVRLSALMNEIRLELARLKMNRESLPFSAVRQALVSLPGSQRAQLASASGVEVRMVGRILEAMRVRGEAVCVGQRRAARWFLASHLDQLTRPGR